MMRRCGRAGFDAATKAPTDAPRVSQTSTRRRERWAASCNAKQADPAERSSPRPAPRWLKPGSAASSWDAAQPTERAGVGISGRAAASHAGLRRLGTRCLWRRRGGNRLAALQASFKTEVLAALRNVAVFTCPCRCRA
jgi:hypothetical protein